jgi:hypothetical protein
MWEPFQRYKALDSQSRAVFRRAAVLLPLVRTSLRLRGYNKTYASLEKRLGPGVPTPVATAEAPVQLQSTCRMVRAAVHYSLVKFTCLEESLTLWFLLSQWGIPARLRIGVRKDDGKFEAHAWVEHNGEALNQPEALHQHYAAFEKDFPEPPVEKS